MPPAPLPWPNEQECFSDALLGDCTPGNIEITWLGKPTPTESGVEPPQAARLCGVTTIHLAQPELFSEPPQGSDGDQTSQWRQCPDHSQKWTLAGMLSDIGIFDVQSLKIKRKEKSQEGNYKESCSHPGR